MYDLYKEKFIRKNKPWVKSTYYRYIFNTCYNTDFHIPKTDRCKKFEEIKIKKSQNISISIEEKNLHDLHVAEELAVREKKNKDKLITNENCLLVVFDLENLITLPKADIGSYCYKRKLTLYNLTPMTSSKQGYCAIWTECMSGRAGNGIASAFMQILNKVAADHLNVTKLICWSDSCVPQNRNSHISQAILECLSKQSKKNVVTMKYSLAGHSCVQEVDKMHQEIEVTMRVTEFYSPPSFLRILLKVNRNSLYRVIQMKSEDFNDFQNSSKMLQFSNVPYTKVFQLKFRKDGLHTVEYKLSHSNTDFRLVSIGKKSRESSSSSNNIHPVQVIETMPGTDIKILISRKQKCDKKLSQAKINDLKSMLHLMPLIDRQYYDSIGIIEQ